MSLKPVLQSIQRMIALAALACPLPLELALALIVASAPAQALDRERSIAQFQHTRWTTQDGAPGEIWAISQTADGWLWLGGTTGLHRFDGVRFEAFEPAAGEEFRSRGISALFALPTGELWIGFIYGGASVLANGHLTHYGEREGLARGQVFAFAQDASGTVWAGTTSGLMRFADGRWHVVGADWNYPANIVSSLVVDQHGTLWVSTYEELMRLPRGASKFEHTGVLVPGGSALRLAHDGSVWVSHAGKLRRLEVAAAPKRPRDVFTAQRQSDTTFFDRDGAIWSAGCDFGLCRLRHPETIDGAIQPRRDAKDSYTARDGLSADSVMTQLEDREGNIWVSTRRGLDRFRHANIVVVKMGDNHLNIALAPDANGAMWSSTNMRTGQPDSLWRIEQQPERVPGVEPPVTCLYPDADGAIWMAGPKGLWRMQDGKFTRLPLPPKGPDTDVHAMTKDGQGRLWIAVVRAGAFRLENGAWVLNGNLPALPTITPTSAITDSQGRVWLGYADSRIAVIDGETAHMLGASNGLQIGAVTAIHRGEYTLAGGELGLALMDGDRFRALRAADGTELGGITGLLRTPEGDLWINSNAGVLRVPASEMKTAIADRAHRLHFEIFDFEDGLPGTAQQMRPLPTLIRSTDGRIWIAATDGLAWLDPQRIRRNTIAPSVAIHGVIAGERLYAASGAPTLARHTTNLRIDYTALSLSIPERVRFRYRLEGADADWQEAGTRRQAFYTNLGPGDYRFQVTAANDDGVWNDTGATLSFSIEPAFVQTKTFLTLCVLAALTLIWGLYHLRMRQLTSRMQGRLEERLLERERIARELHDTLLQGIQGLILRFQAAAARLSPDEPAREIMNKALDRADEVLTESRDRVKNLRSSATAPDDLPRMLENVANDVAQLHPAQFRMVAEGEKRALHPIVREEASQIGREALLNAFRHGEARIVEAEITYDRKELRVRIRDDGRGIDHSVLDSGGRAGHWGLAGMRERARKIRGRLHIWSQPGSGTEVELRVPAAVAYADKRSAGRWARQME